MSQLENRRAELLEEQKKLVALHESGDLDDYEFSEQAYQITQELEEIDIRLHEENEQRGGQVK